MARSSSRNRPPLKHLTLAVGLAAGLALAAGEVRAQEGTEALVEFFGDLAFGAGAQEADPGTVYVKKWLQPLRIAVTALDGELIEHEDGQRELKLQRRKPNGGEIRIIQKHLSTVVELTGVTTEDVKETDKPVNVQIKLVPRLAMAAPFLAENVDPEVLRAQAQSGTCYLLAWNSKTGAIIRTLIVVNNELPEAAFSACMLEELSQLMGLPYESDRITPSVFNTDSQRQELAAVDRVLLKGLYDDRIAPGSQPDEARAAAAKVLPELARESP